MSAYDAPATAPDPPPDVRDRRSAPDKHLAEWRGVDTTPDGRAPRVHSVV
jgi:hypothetical protein